MMLCQILKNKMDKTTRQCAYILPTAIVTVHCDCFFACLSDHLCSSIACVCVCVCVRVCGHNVKKYSNWVIIKKKRLEKYCT